MRGTTVQYLTPRDTTAALSLSPTSGAFLPQLVSLQKATPYTGGRDRLNRVIEFGRSRERVAIPDLAPERKLGSLGLLGTLFLGVLLAVSLAAAADFFRSLNPRVPTKKGKTQSSPEMAPPYASPYVLSFLLLLSIPVVFFLAPRLLPPKTLPTIPDADETEDLALFRRAVLLSTAPSTSASPTTSVFGRRPSPKVAFLFLSNSDLVFSPLWEKFFAGHHDLLNLYVHADPSAVLTLPATPSFRGRLIHGKVTQRASATLISAARRLLATALLDDPANQFFALLSQSCVPLHPFPTLYRTLVSDNAGPRHRHRSFIEILDDEPTLHDRYYARGDDVMLPEVPYDSFRVGSQFFVLARRHAIMVVRDRRLWNKFKMPCLIKRKNSCYPEEHYFPTLLDMQDPDGCTKFTLTRVNWTDSVDGHPHTYRPEEVSGDLIRELRKSNGTYSYMFARKFAPECLGPLMEIADSVILRD